VNLIQVKTAHDLPNKFTETKPTNVKIKVKTRQLSDFQTLMTQWGLTAAGAVHFASSPQAIDT
jgi:hypothetical protein